MAKPTKTHKAPPRPKKPAAKPAVSSRKVFDVVRPGKSMPSASSKPVIVGHTPVVKDDIVGGEPAPIAAPPKPALSMHKITITPLHAATDDAQPVVSAPVITPATPSTPVSPAAPIPAPSPAPPPSPPAPADKPTAPPVPEAPAPVAATTPAPAEPPKPVPSAEKPTPAAPVTSPAPAPSPPPPQPAAKPAPAPAAESVDLPVYSPDHEVKDEDLAGDVFIMPRYSHAKTAGKVFLVIFAILILLLVGANFALDAGLITLDVPVPHTDFLDEPAR